MSAAGAGKLGTTSLRGETLIKASFVLLTSNHFQGVKDPCSHFLRIRTDKQQFNSFQHHPADSVPLKLPEHGSRWFRCPAAGARGSAGDARLQAQLCMQETR